ncbi:hypothetical protein E2553_32260 [Paraburkholderia dipogonis]|uniref:Uncharacterized protein n=1 Tax=Paraburkholderia dipogonis TaxID=1211383 RepID=A0A4Y8MUW8_9BURK|nr:hypothetical protein [Paraburkholderia dipogonis]TFE41346.1 hypothetical protein E2553_32260 [Paraburkholderia dipogonis]
MASHIALGFRASHRLALFGKTILDSFADAPTAATIPRASARPDAANTFSKGSRKNMKAQPSRAKRRHRSGADRPPHDTASSATGAAQ